MNTARSARSTYHALVANTNFDETLSHSWRVFLIFIKYKRGRRNALFLLEIMISPQYVFVLPPPRGPTSIDALLFLKTNTYPIFCFVFAPHPGDHQYCGTACGGSGDLEPEAGSNASSGGGAGGVRGKGKGGAAGKISLGLCGTSALTIASARANTEDARGHFEAKKRRMDEFLAVVEEELQLLIYPEPEALTGSLSALRDSILLAGEKCTEGWILCNGLVQALEEALCVLEPVGAVAYFLLPLAATVTQNITGTTALTPGLQQSL